MEIHQVKGKLVNSYIILQKEKICVVDVAYRGEKYVLGYIDQILNRDTHDVELIVCTHDDPDHISGIRALAKECQSKTGLPFASGKRYRKFINDPAGAAIRATTVAQEIFQPRMWDMYANPKRYQEAKSKPIKYAETRLDHKDRRKSPDFRLKNHDELPGFPGWEVLHTPGHTWDSCCFFHKPSRSIITGDTILASAKKGRPIVPSILSNPIQLATSIKKLKKVYPLHIYPAHGSHLHGENIMDKIRF